MVNKVLNKARLLPLTGDTFMVATLRLFAVALFMVAYPKRAASTGSKTVLKAAFAVKSLLR